MATSTSSDQRTDRIDPPVNIQSNSADVAQVETESRSFPVGIIMTVVVVALLAAGAFGANRWLNSAADDATAKMLVHQVEKGDLVVTITEDGNVESASNIDIKCQVAGGSAILWIVEDGKHVEEGEKLVELEQSQLEDQINSQKIIFEKARAARIQAEKDHASAILAVEEYLLGTFKKEIQDSEANITVAMENLRTAENTLEYSTRMFRKGYVSNIELEGQQFAVRRSELELASAETAKEVLEKYTKVKMVQELESARDTSEARKNSEAAAFQLEEDRLRRLEEQIEHCVINAPSAGMAVYANERGGRFGQQSSSTIEEGAQVRERQNILRLPDLSQMQVKVNVHETKVEKLARGMRAVVKIQDRELQGSIKSIANQPEQSSFFSANVKEYATTVKIDGESNNLKPGMTAEVEILVAHLKDVLTVPVAAVVQQKADFHCWVKNGSEIEKRTLILGLSNEKFVEVKDGLAEGDDVVLNPRAMIDEAKLSDDDGEGDGSVSETFGAGAAEAANEARANAPPEGRGGRGGGERGGRGGGRGGAGRGGMDLSRLDADGDGAISKEEAPEQMHQIFDMMDTNGDGKIDAAEQQAAASRARSAGGGGGGARGGGAGGGGSIIERADTDGDGKLSRDEAPSWMESMFDQLDTNTDGFIDGGEAANMRRGR